MVPPSQAGARACLAAAPALLQHVGSGLGHLGLAPGVRATWDTAFLCTTHPTAGQALAFAITLLPLALLRLGGLAGERLAEPGQGAEPDCPGVAVLQDGQVDHTDPDPLGKVGQGHADDLLTHDSTDAHTGQV